MKEFPYEAKSIPPTDSVEGVENEQSIERFVKRNARFFESYANDASLKIVSAEGVMTDDGPLETCAIDLETGTIYLHPRFLSEVYGGSEEKMLLGALHEIEHFRELRSLLQEEGGADVWKIHRKKIENKKRYHILDNSFDDVKINRTVVLRAPTLHETRRELYLKNLFPDRDLTGLPKHLQFAHVLNCENQDTGKVWMVEADVREEIEKLQMIHGAKTGIPVVEYASNPTTPMSVRLRLQEALIEPVYEKFFEDDVANRRNKKKGSDGKENKNSDGKKTSEDKKSKKSDGEKGVPDSKKSGEPHGQLNEDEASDVATDGNPEDFFKPEYDEWEKRFRHATPDTVVNNEIAKEIKRIASKKRTSDDTGKKMFKEYAQAQGVNAEDLAQYRKYKERVENLKNSATNERVMDELREVFEKIIAIRKKRQMKPAYPLPEGDTLAYPAEAIVRTHAGEEDPDVWEDVETKEVERKYVGSFDMSLIGDTSISMQDKEKDEAERMAMTLVLEALTEFSNELFSEQDTLESELTVRTEARVFGDNDECVKVLSEEFSEKERVAFYKRLGNMNGGSTRDFLSLETILKELSDEDKEKLSTGRLKKIVIVMTDGESNGDEGGDAVARVQRALTKLREAGVVIVGIGITEEGKSALTTYAPDAQLCERVEDLAGVVGELLKEHLETL